MSSNSLDKLKTALLKLQFIWGGSLEGCRFPPEPEHLLNNSLLIAPVADRSLSRPKPLAAHCLMGNEFLARVFLSEL